jgi:hypothetical protein
MGRGRGEGKQAGSTSQYSSRMASTSASTLDWASSSTWLGCARGGCARGGGGQGIYRSRRGLGLGRPRLGCRRRMVWIRRPRGAIGVAPIHGCQHEGKGVEVGSWACAKPWVRLPARTRPASPSHRAGACIARELYGGEVEERPIGRLTRGPRLAAREKRGRVAGLAGLTSVAVRAAGEEERWAGLVGWKKGRACLGCSS